MANKREWKVEFKRAVPLQDDSFIARYWKDWSTRAYYGKREAAVQAVADLKTKLFWNEMAYRLVNTKTKKVENL